MSLSIIADHQGHHASLGAVVRLERQLTDRQRRVYGLVAGPTLRAGQTVPDALFGGTSLGRIGFMARPHRERRRCARSPCTGAGT